MCNKAIKMCMLKSRYNLSVCLREGEGSFIKIISVCIGDEKHALNNSCGRKPSICFAGQGVSHIHCLDSMSVSCVAPAFFPVSVLCTEFIE